MAQGLGNNPRKEIFKRIIRDLHNGLPAEDAAAQVNEEIGTINPDELAVIEQELISEGVPVEEIQLFCNVHALIFKDALGTTPLDLGESDHPIELFLLANKRITAKSVLFPGPAKIAQSVERWTA